MHHLPPTLLLSLLLLLAQLSGRAGSAPIDQRAINAAHANVRLVCLVRAGIASSAAQRAGTLKVLAPVHLAQLVSSYTDTPAMRQLAGGYIGKRRHALAKDLHKSVQAAAEKMLRLCAEEGGLVPLFQSSGQWAVPPAPQLPGCGSKRLHVVVVTSDSIKPGFSMSQHMLGSFRMRGLPLPATLLSRGHNVSWYSARDHAALFDGCLLDPNFRFPFPFGPSADGSTVLALVVKQRPERFMQCFAKHGVPVVLDLIDNTIEYSKYRDYRLILATSRVAALMFERNTGVRALPLYHQPPNYARFHRADRSAPVRSVSMTHQRVNHGLETDELAALIGRYCTLRNITFRLGEYSGHGFDQQELREYLTAPHDWGSQMGYAMGGSSFLGGFYLGGGAGERQREVADQNTGCVVGRRGGGGAGGEGRAGSGQEEGEAAP